MRRSTLIWAVLCTAAVIGLFVIKHEVQVLEERLQAYNAEIISDQEAMQVLQAEWAYLNQPSRLEALSTRLLGMEPPASGQTLTFGEFMDRVKAEEDAEARQASAKKGAPARPSAPDAVAVRAVSEKPSARPAQTPVKALTPAPQEEDADWLKPILAKLKQTQ
jgi:hypothetical protein